MFSLTTIDGAQYIDGRQSHPEAVLCATRVFFFPPKPTYVPAESPVLAGLEPGRWIAEPKIDGKRALVLRGAGAEVMAWSREARALTLPEPVKQAVLSRFPEWTLGDCEWISKKSHLFLLDLVALRGRFMADDPLSDRKLEAMTLFSAPPNSDVFTLVPWKPYEKLPGGFLAWYKERLAEGNEGVVLKHLGSRWKWRPTDGGNEITEWLKVKPVKGLLHDAHGDVVKGVEAR